MTSFDFQIRQFTEADTAEFESFRRQTFIEGNESITSEKLNLADLKGQLLIALSGKKIFASCYAEPSHYTGDPDIACRICRYHVLKEYRSKFTYAGFKMLKLHCQWADSKGMEVVYWTHNVKNKTLNLLYQKKRKYSLGASNTHFTEAPFNEFTLHSEYTFQVSENSDLLQHIYYRCRPDYTWLPKCGVLKKTDISTDQSPELHIETKKS